MRIKKNLQIGDSARIKHEVLSVENGKKVRFYLLLKVEILDKKVKYGKTRYLVVSPEGGDKVWIQNLY